MNTQQRKYLGGTTVEFNNNNNISAFLIASCY